MGTREAHERYSNFIMTARGDIGKEMYATKLNTHVTKAIEECSGLVGESGLTEAQVTALAKIIGSALRPLILGYVSDYHTQVWNTKL